MTPLFIAQETQQMELVRMATPSEAILTVPPGINGFYPAATVVDPCRVQLGKIHGVYEVQLPQAFVGRLLVLDALGAKICEFGMGIV